MSAESLALFGPFLWLSFGFFFIAAAAFGLIIAFHWARYSDNHLLSVATVAIYAAGCVVLLGLMFGAALIV